MSPTRSPGSTPKDPKQRAHPPGGLAQLGVAQHEVVHAQRGVVGMLGGRPFQQGTDTRHGVLQSAHVPEP